MGWPMEWWWSFQWGNPPQVTSTFWDSNGSMFSDFFQAFGMVIFWEIWFNLSYIWREWREISAILFICFLVQYALSIMSQQNIETDCFFLFFSVGGWKSMNLRTELVIFLNLYCTLWIAMSIGCLMVFLIFLFQFLNHRLDLMLQLKWKYQKICSSCISTSTGKKDSFMNFRVFPEPWVFWAINNL